MNRFLDLPSTTSTEYTKLERITKSVLLHKLHFTLNHKSLPPAFSNYPSLQVDIPNEGSKCSRVRKIASGC